MGRFAVIDTETNWIDQVMSIGCCIADTYDYSLLDAKHFVLTPEHEIGGMYESTLFNPVQPAPVICARVDAMSQLKDWFLENGVQKIFAYNAAFDRNHLPELGAYRWYDIMALAAYRQHNPKIPATADCCSTGRLKRGYGVEPMLQLLSGNRTYHELHNALTDAYDELEILRFLGHPLTSYKELHYGKQKIR